MYSSCRSYLITDIAYVLYDMVSENALMQLQKIQVSFCTMITVIWRREGVEWDEVAFHFVSDSVTSSR